MINVGFSVVATQVTPKKPSNTPPSYEKAHNELLIVAE